MLFPVAGIEISPIWPFAVAMCVSFFTSMGGVSGAFLLLPFQMSVWGFTSPSVSATNLVYNIVAIPSGVYRYIREGRMVWSLTWVTLVGTLPGVFIGFLLRVAYFPDPRYFKLFVGFVLLYIGGHLVFGFLPGGRAFGVRKRRQQAEFARRLKSLRDHERAGQVETLTWNWRQVTYRFFGETFTFHVPGVFALSLIVGIVGGTYGIGGGAIVAPVLIAFFGLPVYTVAGAALMGTFGTSVAGVVFYAWAGPLLAPEISVRPDWLLGCLLGLGGFTGMYLGARCQRFVPETWIKAMLAALLVFLAASYIVGFFA